MNKDNNQSYHYNKGYEAGLKEGLNECKFLLKSVMSEIDIKLNEVGKQEAKPKITNVDNAK